MRRWWPSIPGDKGQPVSVPSLRAGYRGINIVHDPAENLEATRVLPEPGGLPGVEPLTPFPCPAMVAMYPVEHLSDAKPATCDMHGRPLDEEIEREADALTDHLLASPFSPFRPRPPGTYR